MGASTSTTIIEIICIDKSILVLRDGGANMVKGMRLAELPDLSCTAHTLQLIINEGLSSQRAVLDIIAILKSCATHFGHSVLAKQRLRTIQEELGVQKHNIIQAIPTHWNSTLHMLQRMYEQRRALNVYAGEHGHISCLSATQWDIVCNLTDTLVPIEDVTMEMSNSGSSAACIIPRVSVLKLMLQEEGPSSGGIKTLCKTMLDSLTKRFSKTEETKIIGLATFLDPRYKACACLCV
ncbi:zinc finger BED domain-containing protein 4-like [Sinocyclocheilus anshuiensis]|uniref:zinc finger BED domain-containing protein 4-like n=1 Tax=Sinocyclocheilus anshuiensis TaxID=1608454 RepID=UPI0007B7A7C5|nr:PREDICTED: zinc finger BED domain-containing protein 4-like [Sinocyclocheilus anshuiensis]